MKTKQTQVKKPTQSRIKKHAKKVFVPHKENQYRPYLIRAHGLVAVLVIALLAQVVYGFISTGRLSVLGRVSDIKVAELLVNTNSERELRGLPDLQLNAALSQAAFLKAQNMFAEQYWAHVSPSGTQPWKWFADVGYNYSYAGENLAKNYPDAQTTVSAWMASETHRANILSDKYVDVGFAAVDGQLMGEDTTLIVAMYGAPATASMDSNTSSINSQTSFFAPLLSTKSQNPFGYFVSALKSLSPVTIAILILLVVVGTVGLAAHKYRRKLPKSWKKSWRAHHGLYTFVGMIALGILVIIATGGGAI